MIAKPILWLSQLLKIRYFLIFNEEVQVLRVITEVKAGEAESKIVANFENLVCEYGAVDLILIFFENMIE